MNKPDGTQAQKRDWLLGYQVLTQECDRLRGEIAHWRDVAEGATLCIGGGATARTPHDNKIERTVAEICHWESELLQALRRRVALRRSIEEAVQAVQDRRLATCCACAT